MNMPPSPAPPRLFCPKLSEGLVTLDEDETHHARRALRLRPGDAVLLLDGAGSVGRGTLVESPAGEMRRPARRGARPLAACVDELVHVQRPVHELTLIVPGCKGDRLRWLVEKCTELGVTALAFTRYERSVVLVGAHHAAKLRRYAIEACKQSSRQWLPRIDCTAALPTAPVADTSLFVADVAADLPCFDKALGDPLPLSITVIIGPEGGLTDGERQRLRACGAVAVTLGPNVLRVETAAVAVAAVWIGRTMRGA